MLQVFDNIVGNAIKFSAQGAAVSLRVERSPEACTFAILDEGRGIPDSQLPLFVRPLLDGAPQQRR